jgi:hypothetical protein
MITFAQFILEGGVAGHMAHPFDLPSTNTGKNLITVFQKLAKRLATNPSVVKIDGANASIKLITNAEGKKEFAMDRGSNKPEDVHGVTIATLGNRFPQGHGMLNIGKTVLEIFNSAIPTIEKDLKKLKIWNNNKLLFNMEYVQGATNVVGYEKNFLAIHSLNEIIEIKSSVRGSIRRASREVNYDKKALTDLIAKVNPIAKQKGFDIEHEFLVKLGNVDFNTALNSPFTVSFDTKNIVTRPLKDWLATAKNPRADKIKLVSGKTISAMSLENYKNITSGTPLNYYIGKNKKIIEKAISGAVFYQATMSLGQAIKDAASSDLGPLSTQEGIVVRDKTISSNPVKITGNFILGKEQGKFATKRQEEEENPRQMSNQNYIVNPEFGKEGARLTLTPETQL